MRHTLITPLSEQWVLITYDVPATEGARRKRLLRQLRKLGAQRHTDSCYYLPNQPEALSLVDGLPGECYVWVSNVSEELGERLTREWIQSVHETLREVKRRLRQLIEEWTTLATKTKRNKLRHSERLFANAEQAAKFSDTDLFSTRLSHVRQLLEDMWERLAQDPR